MRIKEYYPNTMEVLGPNLRLQTLAVYFTRMGTTAAIPSYLFATRTRSIYLVLVPWQTVPLFSVRPPSGSTQLSNLRPWNR
jgi:hypothetical protein